MAYLITIIACFVSFSVSELSLASAIVSPVSEYVHAPGKFIAPIPPHSLRVERDVSLEMCAAKCTIYFRTRQFPCYAFEYTAGSRMCVYTNMTTLLIQDGYLGLHDNPSVDFYERSKASYKNLFRKISDSALSKQSSYFHIKQNSSLEECSFHCVISHAHTCMSFSYSHASGTCGLSNTLYSSQSKEVSLIHTTLYDHYQYITAWPCNATLASNYAPHVFASLKYPYMAMQNVNCHVTIEAPKDKTITLSIPTVYFKQSVCDVIGAGITVLDGAEQSAPIKAKICSTTQGVYSVKSTSDTLHIKFRTGQIPMAFQGVYEFNNPDPPRNPCESSKCVNGATCQPSGKGYNCACVAGFTGVFCGTNIDDCVSSPCFFGGTCNDEIDDFSCVCEGNFTGKRCEKYLGMCANNPCVHGSCLTTGRYSYACNCAPNYMGKNCDIRFQPCMTKPCTHGSCVENGSDYQCICETGYTGRNCDVNDNNPCTPDPCVRGSCMIYAPNQTYVCVCESGFTGRLCNYVINHCEGVDCGFGHCLSYQTGYKCLCDDQYAGTDCRLPLLCQGVDCGNGTCVMNITSSPVVHCRCSDGYEGDRCNKKIDYCDNSHCLHGRCENAETGYVCVCDKGFAGLRCGEEVNPCLGADCGYGICEATANQTYRCICARGFSGPQCGQNTTTALTTPNPCLSHPCQHGGVCRLMGSTQYACECGQENGVTYRGKHCETMMTSCKSSYCTLGHCVPTENSYRCLLDLHGVSNSTASPLHIPTDNVKTVERSDIACNAENIEVFLPQSLIHTTSSITWLDPNCSIVFNGTHFISKILHDQCGTTVGLTQSNVIFENKIIAHPFKTENSVLDFGTTPTEISVKCIYPRTEMTMSSYQPVKQQVRVYEKRFGHLNINMRQYETNQFKHALNDLSTPRKLELSSDIFISVGLPKRDTPELGIHLDTCIATKTSTPYDNAFITLIENGCSKVNFVHFLPSPANEARFSLKTFQFTSSQSNIVYIHCQAVVCLANSSQCSTDCSSSRRTKRDVSPATSHLLSIGPLMFVTKSERGLHMIPESQEASSNVVANIIAGVSAMVAMVAVVFAALSRRKTKTVQLKDNRKGIDT